MARGVSQGAPSSLYRAQVDTTTKDELWAAVETFDAEGLRAAREHLSALIGRMRAGEFEVTENPYAALCFGCPAAARLCPRPAWRP